MSFSRQIMSTMKSVATFRKISLNRFFSQKSTSTTATKKSKSGDDPKVGASVTGLSSYVIKQKSEPLGPGASSSGPYKVPEYFCYDRFSYHGAEVELAKYRCPQPSALK